ncbi:hypothetical protein ACKAV7_015183 [Fusarium commune]
MNPINTTNLFPDDVLPPEGHFPSQQALVTAINAWARERGYAFSVKNSWNTSSGRKGVIYNCDRGSKPPSTTRERVRNTVSRHTGCLFSVIAKEGPNKTSWSLSHRPDQKHHKHNHEPSNPLAHPTHRILSAADRQIVKQLTSCGSAPKDIISHLRNTSTTLATQQDIYNCIAESKRELLKGQSNIHALANQLESEGFWSRIRLEEGTVTAVLFAHPKSLAYLKSYTEVLILDCTYKTNKYKMPLLNAIGVDACQRSFCISFAFLSSEEEEDYNWALAQLRSIYIAICADFPSVILTDRCLACMNAVTSTFPDSTLLLCLWHINKAVLRHCIDAFTKDAKDHKGQEKWKDFYSSWHDLVASSNEDIYYQKLSDFKKKYIPDYVSQVGYITETWLDLHKEKFVKAWVNQHLHFNQYVTSRCEGIHQLIKSYLKTSQLNLFDAWRHIKLVITNQVAELESNQARQQASFPLKLSGLLYGNIRGWISHEALRLVDDQRARLLYQLPACTGTFNRTLVAGPSTATAQSEVNELDYDDARAIYRRYKADREAWYATQPRGALKTNQQYRKAMKLPQRYTKAKYNWCLDYKEMGPQCRIGRSVRDWTKEEMMAYLDFDEAENERVNKQVEEELKARRFTTYRGPDYVWKAAARDYEDQQRVHRTRNRRI